MSKKSDKNGKTSKKSVTKQSSGQSSGSQTTTISDSRIGVSQGMATSGSSSRTNQAPSNSRPASANVNRGSSQSNSQQQTTSGSGSGGRKRTQSASSGKPSRGASKNGSVKPSTSRTSKGSSASQSKTKQQSVTNKPASAKSTSNANRASTSKTAQGNSIKNQAATAGSGNTKDQQNPDEDNAIESVEGVFEKDPKTEALFRKKHYKALKRLAHGAFGQVYKGARTDEHDQPIMDQLVAIKVVEMTKLGPAFREKYLPQELAALTHVEHHHVIRVHDIFRANERLFIFMEFAPNGDLSGYLKKNGPMREKLAQFWFGQVVQALTYVHATLRMAHRDIKLDNVLLDAKMDAKLTDFGFAKECWDSKRHCASLSQTICGTQPYFCPQIVDRVPYNAYMADVWAMGTMLYVMLNYRFPFHYDQDPAVWMVEMTNYPNFIKSRFLATVSSSAIELTVGMLNPDEKSRMTLHEAMKHKWLAKQVDRREAFESK